MNKVVLVGRLTKDPDVRCNNDTAVARFTVAINRKFKNKDRKYDADFINCICFKNTAEFVEKYFVKGMMIGLSGRIQTGSFTNKDGQKVYTTDIVADEVEFVESKKEQESATKNDDGGFTNIPDAIDDEELPFN